MSSAGNEVWNVSSLGWRINVNSQYNTSWINSNGLIQSAKSIDELTLEGINVSDSHPHEVGWLRNIDRLIDMLPLSFNPSAYDLLDMGCGSGISTLYFLENYPFRSFSGIDFSPELISTAACNLQRFNAIHRASYNIDFLVCDAREYLIDYSSQGIFVYMFNPFGFETASVFIAKNLERLRLRSGIIALSWDTWIWQLLAMKWHKAVFRNSLYKLSLVVF